MISGYKLIGRRFPQGLSVPLARAEREDPGAVAPVVSENSEFTDRLPSGKLT